MKNLKEKPVIVWVGFHEEGRYCIDALWEKGFEVSAIFTLDSEAMAKRSGVYDYQHLSEKYNIPLYHIGHVNDDSSIMLLQALDIDILFVIGWSQILSEKALSCARWVVGAHASKLPENRGSAPINWSLIKGEESTGNTLIELTAGVDAGDILAQRAFDISYFDSCKTLYEHVAVSNAEMVVEFCENYRSDNVRKIPQTNLDKPVLPRRRPEHGIIDWEQPSRNVYNFVRALTKPYPGAYFYYLEKKCTVWNCSWSPSNKEQLVAGEVVGANFSFEPSNCGVSVSCSEGVIVIHELQVDDKILIGQDLIEFMSAGNKLNQ